MKDIKKIISLVMFVTGSALLILAVFAAIFNLNIPFVPVVFEIFAGNIVIILGLYFRWKIELPHIILEYLIDIIYISIVLILCGYIFDWFSDTPVWMLVAMAAAIYFLAMLIVGIQFKKDTDEMNELLQKRKDQENNTAS
jgi:hypothetical protein